MKCFSFLTLPLIFLPGAALAQVAAKPYTGLVVFGDSYSDVGNLLIATTALEPGTGQPAQPAPDHYFDGRFANGPIYLDILAFGLGTTIRPSLRGGNDYAFGGALTAANTVEVPPYGTGPYPHAAYPWSLEAETQAFGLHAAANGADPNALYVVFSGLNDVAAILQGDPTESVQATIGGILGAIETIKAAGGKTVLVPNLLDEGKLPVVTALEPVVPGISAAATALTVAYNTALAAALYQETGIRIIRFNTFGLLHRVVAHPARYGFTDVTNACYNGPVTPDPGATVCAAPNRYVFWDSEHPTSAFQTLLGAEMLLKVYSRELRERPGGLDEDEE